MKLGPKISVAVTHQITSPESDFSVLTRDVMVHHGKPKRWTTACCLAAIYIYNLWKVRRNKFHVEGRNGKTETRKMSLCFWFSIMSFAVTGSTFLVLPSAWTNLSIPKYRVDR